MKTILNQEQTIKLIKLGVPAEKATGKVCCLINDSGRSFPQRAFTLADLFEILPKEMSYDNKLYELHIDWMNSAWWTSYQWDGIKGSSTLECKSEELIDALYELACWYYGEYLKSKEK